MAGPSNELLGPIRHPAPGHRRKTPAAAGGDGEKTFNSILPLVLPVGTSSIGGSKVTSPPSVETARTPMSIFEPIQVALAAGRWQVKVTTGADAVEYISHEHALRLADELEAEGWGESAGQVRKAAEMAMRFQSYARP